MPTSKKKIEEEDIEVRGSKRAGAKKTSRKPSPVAKRGGLKRVAAPSGKHASVKKSTSTKSTKRGAKKAPAKKSKRG
jgi:hypothetical protein